MGTYIEATTIRCQWAHYETFQLYTKEGQDGGAREFARPSHVVLDGGEHAMATEGEEEDANGEEIAGWLERWLIGSRCATGQVQHSAEQDQQYGQGCGQHRGHNRPPKVLRRLQQGDRHQSDSKQAGHDACAHTVRGIQ